MKRALLLLLALGCTSPADTTGVDTGSGETDIVATGVVREYTMTATHGSYELKMDGGMVMGSLDGYLLNGQFLGPALVADVGDTIRVTLRNDTDVPIGLHPHGVRYDMDNEGMSRVAPPGGEVTYEWEALHGAGTFLYHSHELDEELREYQGMAGILGVLVIRDPVVEEAAGTDGMLNYVLMNTYEPWTTIDESMMGGAAEEGADTAEEHEEDEQHNHTLVVQSVLPDGQGGWTTDTLESLTAQAEVGQTMRMNVVGFGEQFHTFHTHGYVWEDSGSGQVMDTVVVGPATSYAFHLDLDNPGLWMVHCHVDSHLHMMMSYLYVQD